MTYQVPCTLPDRERTKKERIHDFVTFLEGKKVVLDVPPPGHSAPDIAARLTALKAVGADDALSRSTTLSRALSPCHAHLPRQTLTYRARTHPCPPTPPPRRIEPRSAPPRMREILREANACAPSTSQPPFLFAFYPIDRLWYLR